MILYKPSTTNGKRDRASRSMAVSIDELPERPKPKFRSPKDRKKYIMSCEAVIRKSSEYKEYIKFLKQKMNMSKCAVLRGLDNTNGKHYTIEIHHEPFTLFDIVETVLAKRETYGESLGILNIADEVMELHYSGEVGLIPLSKTVHELVHHDRIFIPLQFIYHDYANFYKQYQPHINPSVKDKIEAKVNLSLRTDDVVSDSLDVEFVYVSIDGFDFPQIPDEWKSVVSMIPQPESTK